VTELPGGHGVAVPLSAGAAMRLVNTFGSQVVDTACVGRCSCWCSPPVRWT